MVFPVNVASFFKPQPARKNKVRAYTKEIVSFFKISPLYQDYYLAIGYTFYEFIKT